MENENESKKFSMENENESKKFSGHVMVLSYSTVGHTHPLLQFAKNLASKGFLVSFVSLHFDHRRMVKAREYLQSLGHGGPGLVQLEWILKEIPPQVPLDHHIQLFLCWHYWH
ncbi:hypothetical protein SUGI_0004520 [Cryptomeria japonica]|nr:hypothetical protein SUGI_0004520 [Cryptomeria japonica]